MRPALVRSVYTVQYIRVYTRKYTVYSGPSGIPWPENPGLFFPPHCPKNNLFLYTYKSSGSDWIECVCPTPDTWHLLLHPLQPWQARFLCGDSDYFWDSAGNQRQIYQKLFYINISWPNGGKDSRPDSQWKKKYLWKVRVFTFYF